MDKLQMDAVTSTLGTKSAKIRALNALGVTRADISRYLGIRYQHVRNVLVADEASQASGGYVAPSGPTALAAPAAPAPIIAAAFPVAEPPAAPERGDPVTLTIDQAKRGLSAHFGVSPEAIEIIIRG